MIAVYTTYIYVRDTYMYILDHGSVNYILEYWVKHLSIEFINQIANTACISSFILFLLLTILFTTIV